MSVRSTTSCSSRRALQEAPWGRTWLCTAALVLLAVGGLELQARAHGLRPSVEDGDALWASTRDEVEGGRQGLVVLIGSSRVQGGLDVSAFEARLGAGVCVQLALRASESLVLLEDVATAGPRGALILCELHPVSTFLDVPASRELPLERLAYRERREAWRPWETRLQAEVRTRLASLRPHLSPLGIRHLVRPAAWPELRRITTLPTRQQLADYSSTGGGRGSELYWAGWALELRRDCPPRDMKVLSRRLGELVARLAAHGGRVVFLRMPSSGLTKEAEDVAYPREATWDRLVESGVEAEFVHFEDEPELREVRCADGVHLDEGAAREFTRGLIAVLERRGVLRAATSGDAR